MTTGVNNNTTNTGTNASTNNTAMQQLSGNMNTFLTLLTTQLQNQDPLSPMDSTQFTQQLVEYSQVEQQINTNSNLTSLISLQQAGAGAASVGYLGKKVTRHQRQRSPDQWHRDVELYAAHGRCHDDADGHQRERPDRLHRFRRNGIRFEHVYMEWTEQ